MLEMEAGKSLFCSRSSATSRLLEFLQVVPGRRVYGETILGWGLLTTSAFIVPRSCSRRHSSNDVWNIFRPTQNLPQFARRSSQFLQSGTCPSPPDGIKPLPLIAALSLQWTLGRGGEHRWLLIGTEVTFKLRLTRAANSSFKLLHQARGGLIVFWWPNTNTIQYKYEYYSFSQNWPNTNTNVIRLPRNDQIRIRILFGFPEMTEYEYKYHLASQ